MASTEERMRILMMIQEGKISAAEGARLIEALDDLSEPSTPAPPAVNQVAGKLGLSNSRLYYHFNLLEKHGLIEVVETHMVNNNQEVTKGTETHD